MLRVHDAWRLAVKQRKDIGFTLTEMALLLSERDDGAFDAVQLIDRARLRRVREYGQRVADGDAALILDPECGFLLRFLAAPGVLPAAPAPSSLRKNS